MLRTVSRIVGIVAMIVGVCGLIAAFSYGNRILGTLSPLIFIVAAGVSLVVAAGITSKSSLKWIQIILAIVSVLLAYYTSGMSEGFMSYLTPLFLIVAGWFWRGPSKMEKLWT